jgi:SRSO17 transposase
VIENLGDATGVLIADPTGFAKKGKKSAGVQRQYSGTLGRIDNYQIGTFLAFVNTAGDRVLVDRELYIPEKTWFGDRDRCTEAAIPPDLQFATRPAQVIAMIKRCAQAGLQFGWFTADEEFGQNPGLRDYLEDTITAYVMAIPKSTEYTDTTGCTTEIKNIPGQLPPNAWQRRACGIGTKGYRVYDWAVIDGDDNDHQYMIRRSIDDGELAFYRCYNPHRESHGELVRVAGTRWPVEECFQTAKSSVGLDNYQVRLYHAWYRHITLAMVAQSFLAVLARRHHSKKGDLYPIPMSTTPTPPPRRTNTAGDSRATTNPQPRHRIRLTLAEVRRLFNVRDQTKHVKHTAMNWSTYRREHRAEARSHHFARRLKIQHLAL